VRPPVYAHRLGSRYGPECSRLALEHSLEGGVEGAEVDIVLSADDDVVCVHDPFLRIATARAAPILATPPGALGYGLALGAGCAEWVPYEQGSVLSIGRRAFPAYPESVLAPALHVSYLPASCRVWPVPKAPAEQRAATPSTIPTLLLSGSFDGITPTSWARIAARTLPNSTVADFAGIGHAVTLASPCAQQVLASFLTTPGAPDTACVAAVRPPTFAPAPAARPRGPGRG
jgi:glycerophosphoryl diester phosphodiesterase